MAAKHKMCSVPFTRPFIETTLNLNWPNFPSFLEHLPKSSSQKKKVVLGWLLLVFLPALQLEIQKHFFPMWLCCISEACDHLVFCSISSLFRHCHAPSYILITDFLLPWCLIHCHIFPCESGPGTLARRLMDLRVTLI